jgi:type II secretory ATPase GspE/PulE/Tfp pilus assembly ATPase PilB-like protein
MRSAAREYGLIPLCENRIEKMLGGHTTCQEILRVTWEQV